LLLLSIHLCCLSHINPVLSFCLQTPLRLLLHSITEPRSLQRNVLLSVLHVWVTIMTSTCPVTVIGSNAFGSQEELLPILSSLVLCIFSHVKKRTRHCIHWTGKSSHRCWTYLKMWTLRKSRCHTWHLFI
jgi:hypothetical protein